MSQAMDIAVGFGHGDERIRRNQFAVTIAQAHQRLEADQLGIDHAHLRLIVNLDAVGIQGIGQIVGAERRGRGLAHCRRLPEIGQRSQQILFLERFCQHTQHVQAELSSHARHGKTQARIQ